MTDHQADFIARQTALSLPNAKLTAIETDAVDVNFRIGERRVERLFVVATTDGSNRRVSVILYGPQTVLRDLKVTELQAAVSKNDSGADTPQITLPAELQGVVEVRKTRFA